MPICTCQVHKRTVISCIIRYNYNGDARYRDTILVERSRSILTMILDLEIGGTVLSGKQNEINKTAQRRNAVMRCLHLRPPRIDVIRIILSVCLRSAARVNISRRVRSSHRAKGREEKRRIVRFCKCQESLFMRSVSYAFASV